MNGYSERFKSADDSCPIHRLNFASIFARGMANRSRDSAMSLSLRPTRFSSGGSIFARNGSRLAPPTSNFTTASYRSSRPAPSPEWFCQIPWSSLPHRCSRCERQPAFPRCRTPPAGSVRQLVNVLVRQRQAEPVFARLRQNRGKRIRREILKLVNEQVKIPAFGFRPVGARHRAQLKLRHQQRTKQVRLVVTVRETARMFEAAGVARTERSIINWCQPNRQGIARLDSYFDPNERKYYITPQSVEAVIQEEIQRSKNSNDVMVSESFGSRVEPVKHAKTMAAENAGDERKVLELEREILDLKIANRGKDYLIDQLKVERIGVFEKLLSATRTVGQLETKLLHLDAPKSED